MFKKKTQIISFKSTLLDMIVNICYMIENTNKKCLFLELDNGFYDDSIYKIAN